MESTATLSSCRKYRYVLWRIWDEHKPYAVFIGLNPSIADETEDDPTIRRCVNFAKGWGYGGLCMVNLFAYRSRDPSNLFCNEEPIGSENDEWILRVAKNAGVVVAAWGNDGKHLSRSAQVRGFPIKLKILRLNKSGEPAHPLYLPNKLEPIDWS
ncbi:DUF1643 domain-containing protein [Chitinibacter sp. GC72]|uniref:DUF1643 domain-containing protein n=1 Tax=Chitinibacter sp. GC72 TaxID=1526917 RepID=UPI0012F7E98D|nr:DUF1643 domain-containing protein [Chitinibacter sp. GC72]